MTKRPVPAPICVAYSRVSTSEQLAGLDAQHEAMSAEAARRGWAPEYLIDRGVSGSVTPDSRPALGPALARLDAHGGVLMVARFDRVSRSLADLALLLDRAQRRGWVVVVTDAAGLDLSTPTGRMVAGVLGSVAAFERDLIRARTREALAARKAAGVRLGRPRQLDPATAARIHARRANGATLWSIAHELNAEGITTPSGRPWTHATVRKITMQQPYVQAVA